MQPDASKGINLDLIGVDSHSEQQNVVDVDNLGITSGDREPGFFKEVPQPVIWVVQFKDGTHIKEFEPVDGGFMETIFDSKFLERKADFAYIGLMDLVNHFQYSINLITGQFVLQGQKFSLGKELDGRTYPINNVPGVKYSDGVIQYKVSRPMPIPMNHIVSIQAKPLSFNIGYKVDLPNGRIKYPRGDNLYEIQSVQSMISINAEALQPCISTSFLAEVTDINGNKSKVRL